MLDQTEKSLLFKENLAGAVGFEHKCRLKKR